MTSYVKALGFAALIVSAGCIPCDCEEATLLAPRIPGQSVKITFDESLFGEDKFTITVVQGVNRNVISGTYEEDDDRIKFNVDGEVQFLAIRSGEVNAIDCDEATGRFTITPPAAPGVPPVALTFLCTRKA